MDEKTKLFFIDDVVKDFSIEGNNNPRKGGAVLKVISPTRRYYASAWLFIKEFPEDKFLSGDWINTPDLKSLEYDKRRFIHFCTIEDIETNLDAQETKDGEILKLEEKLVEIKEIHPQKPFRLDGKNKLHISIVRVGQGDLILIKFPSGRSMIIDAHYYGLIQESVFDKLDNFFGNANPTVIFATHKHLDHIRHIVQLADRYRIKECWWGFCPRHPHSSMPVKNILTNLPRNRVGTQILRITKDVHFKHSDFYMHLWYPGPSICRGNRDPNLHSIILELHWGKVRIILGGDLTDVGWTHLSHRLFNTIHLFKVPHHCSRNGLSHMELANLRMRYSVTSCGEHKIFKHPHCEPLVSYIRSSTQHFITRLLNNRSVDFVIEKTGKIKLRGGNCMTVPADCNNLECYSTCSRSCYS